jgi:signal peptidase II
LKRFPPALILSLAIVVFDQLTKWLVETGIPVDQSIFPIPGLANVLSITHVRNTGIAFGLFKDANTIFILISIVIIPVMLRYLGHLPRAERLMHIALSAMVGGATGNLIDRLRLGYVIDFVAIGPLPRFNVADCGIIGGLILIVLLSLFSGKLTSD